MGRIKLSVFIQNLEELYKENCEFLDREEQKVTIKHSKIALNKFKRLNSQLSNYIETVKNGGKRALSLQDWNSFFRDILLEDKL